jgi:hypothetical protein
VSPVLADILLQKSFCGKGVTIKWDNRSVQAILHNDMAKVERVPVKV